MGGLVCDCTGSNRKQKDGWTRRDDGVWVHPRCMRPSPVAFAVSVERDEAMRTELNIFQGGDHHNEIWTTGELLRGRGDGGQQERLYAPWITSYKWTPETITGSASGRVARVWRPEE